MVPGVCLWWIQLVKVQPLMKSIMSSKYCSFYIKEDLFLIYILKRKIKLMSLPPPIRSFKFRPGINSSSHMTMIRAFPGLIQWICCNSNLYCKILNSGEFQEVSFCPCPQNKQFWQFSSAFHCGFRFIKAGSTSWCHLRNLITLGLLLPHLVLPPNDTDPLSPDPDAWCTSLQIKRWIEL